MQFNYKLARHGVSTVGDDGWLYPDIHDALDF